MSLKVRALLFASLRDAAGAREVEEELSEGSSVADLSRRLTERFPALAERLPRVRVAVNEAFAEPAHLLSHGDHVAYLPPVSGGAPTGFVRLQQDRISVDEVLDSVRRNDCGAVVLFLGTVRDSFQGQPVTGMDYEAYAPLAEHAVQDICRQASEQWPVAAITVVHRTGTLALGDVSVAIAASSPHRSAAFEAGRYVIDRLKELVPIWKREHLADGAVWIEGEERIESKTEKVNP